MLDEDASCFRHGRRSAYSGPHDKSTDHRVADRARNTRMKRIPLSEVKDDLSRYLHIAESEEVIITRHGKPAGVLIGFESEEDWFEYRLEHDPRFLRRIEAARDSLRAGRGTRLEDVETD